MGKHQKHPINANIEHFLNRLEPSKTGFEPIFILRNVSFPIGREIEATAILQETTQNATIQTVSIGTKLGEDTVVADIQPKQVILKKGKLQTSLRLSTTISDI